MISTGLVSGARKADKTEVEERARGIAGGLQAQGVEGDCVAILMRNDIAFLEASYAAMMLGAYAVPLNWHFKPDEIAYVLADSGAKAADLLHGLGAVPDREFLRLAVETPPEIITAYQVEAAHLSVPAGVIAFEAWLA